LVASAAKIALVPSEFIVAAEDSGERLDRYLASQMPDLSRTRIQELIRSGLVLVDAHAAKDSLRLKGGEHISVDARPRPSLRAEPEPIPLDVLYEDEDVVVINKPAGMTVHAGAGNSKGTLVNALLGRGQALSHAGDTLRPGIVHRLDRETSGAILVAKNDAAHAKLSEDFRHRKIKKSYIALVHGALKGDRGSIDFAIARDPHRRIRMTARPAAKPGKARAALTDWRVLARFRPATLVEVTLHTGRTHQIRVHFSAIKHPIVGDTLYGAPAQVRIGKTSVTLPDRNFLHAARLGFAHPRSNRWVDLRAPLPDELLEFLRALAAAEHNSADRVAIDAALAPYL
jgi:23S rRNA pseudouridine1911/1915/1917 synthase